jgi:hypothetical protein
MAIPMVLAVVVCLVSTPTLNAQQPEFGAYCSGDADLSGDIELADVVTLVNYLFRKADPPQPFYLQGDVDCSGRIGLRDPVRLVSYLFRQDWRASPCEWCGRYYLDESGLTEARIMALWYAETLEPPADLTLRFQSDLAVIRNDVIEAEPALDGLFYSPAWTPSVIGLYVDSLTAHAIADSSYHAWDSLNQVLQLDSLWVGSWYEGVVYSFRLHFQGLKNPGVLASAYAGLPGVLYPSYGGKIGQDMNNVWPYVKQDTATYLFVQGWGDCPAGCIRKRFYYVVATPDSTWFVGSWLRVSGASDAPPDWWPQACENLQRSYLNFLCDSLPTSGY